MDQYWENHDDLGAYGYSIYTYTDTENVGKCIYTVICEGKHGEKTDLNDIGVPCLSREGLKEFICDLFEEGCFSKRIKELLI